GPGVVGRPQQPPTRQAASGGGVVVAVVPEVVDRIEAVNPAAHGPRDIRPAAANASGGRRPARHPPAPATSFCMASRYLTKAARPLSLRLTDVRGLRPTKAFSTST